MIFATFTGFLSFYFDNLRANARARPALAGQRRFSRPGLIVAAK